MSRSRGFTSNGVSLPVTFGAIDAYATRYEIEDFEDFLYVITSIDDAYLKDEADRRKRKDRKDKRGAKKRNHS